MKGLIIGSVMVLSLGLTVEQRKMGPDHLGEMPMMMQMMQECPMTLLGVDLAVADTAGGIALAFTAEKGDAVELRRRVELMAKMHRGMMPGKTMMQMIPAA